MKRKKAAALKYQPGYNAPVITALGAGEIAEKIIDTALKNDVPIIENGDLTEALSKVSVGDNIPSELYQAVAEIIAFIYRLNDEENY
jgi:flagellar biosynthesis protein